MQSSLGRPRSRDRSPWRRRRTPQSLRLAGDRCLQPDGFEGGTTMPDADDARGRALSSTHPFEIEAAKARLAEQGGYEVVHSSPGLEIGVYVLVAPEPDHQQPHADDEVYVVLEGRGTPEVEGERADLREGHAAFVPAGVRHRFVGYEQLSVLVIFEKGRP